MCHSLKILFAVRSATRAAEVAFISFNHRQYGHSLFPTCTSKIDFRNPRLHVLQFSHYFSVVLLHPFSVNHVLYLDTKPKHRPQKVIPLVSTTAETINSFTSHLFLHFIQHSPLPSISVVCEINSYRGLRCCTQFEHPLLPGTVR